MDRKYPREFRIVSAPLSRREKIRLIAVRVNQRLRDWLRRLWRLRLHWPWLDGSLHDREHYPLVKFVPETGAPSLTVTRPTGRSCRTRHGAARVYWNCSSSEARSSRVANCRLPDGTRGDAGRQFVGAGWWRRKGSGDKLWIIGEIQIGSDDVVFVDRASPDLEYTPPTDPLYRLEHDIATHRPFVEALADDEFAFVTYGMLTNLDWVRVDTGEIGMIDGIHHVVACLRNKGEDWFDFKFGSYPVVNLTAAKWAEHGRRLKELMYSLGWAPIRPPGEDAGALWNRE